MPATDRRSAHTHRPSTGQHSTRRATVPALLTAALLALATLSVTTLAVAPVGQQAHAQQRIQEMPGYDQYTEMAPKLRDAYVSGAVRVNWAEDGESFTYEYDGTHYRYDVRDREATAIEEPGDADGRRFRGPARGRQFEEYESPDGSMTAYYDDRNVWLRDAEGANVQQLTTDGSEKYRIKNGSASWVYGEELGQRTAMWWSPDSRKLAYFRFDESHVLDFYLQMDQTEIQSSLDIEAYPKAGTTNPVVDIYVHDIESGERTHIDVRDGEPLTDDVVGHYAYNVSWTPDGEELLIHRTNRRQNVMELAACSPDDGSCRVVVREEWPASWTDNRPEMQWLSDGLRFVWESERTGWRNYYLYDLHGGLVTTLTRHEAEVAGIVAIEEDANGQGAGTLFYMARTGENHMMMQLHQVGLDGRGDTRLTDPSLNHSVQMGPGNEVFVDIAQSHDVPPETRLVRAADGRVIDTITESDVSGLEELGKEPVEMFTFMSADGETELHGMLAYPSNFDPSKSYPMLVGVYSGPRTNGARETFSTGSSLTEFGFLVASLDARSAAGRGKEFLDAIYESLGVTEIDDLAAGVRALRERDYVDGENVGIYGTSYGGYASAMAILRHPDVFHAAMAASSVTDWRHYDTIYTERYMYTPQANPEGYDAGSAMTYADQLEGALMIYYGTADNNVHPNNSMQLIQALQEADKSFEVQVGPDRGHSGINTMRMMEFFIQNLVL